MIRPLLKQDEDTSDDIDLFFKSIGKTVRKFPLNLQQRAKMETLTLIPQINFSSERKWFAIKILK